MPLSVEPSWANIADKLTYGRLHAAVILPPLAFAVSLGLRGIGTPLIVPMSLSLNGNSVTVSNAIAAPVDAVGGGRAIAAHGQPLAERDSGCASRSCMSIPPIICCCATGSRGGIDPDRDIELSVVPPAETVERCATGQIAGFCAGAPWGEVAARAGSAHRRHLRNLAVPPGEMPRGAGAGPSATARA